MKNIINLTGGILLFACCTFPGCSKKEKLPVVITSEVTGVTGSTAKSGGEIVNNGNAKIIAKGICWGTDTIPDVYDYLTNDGYGDDAFVSVMENLDGNTLYYVRAYATNITGTGYGEILSFRTPEISGGGGSSGTPADDCCGVWVLLFSEDFESYSAGSYPDAPWVMRFSGISAGVSEEQAYQSSQSFKQSSQPMWARVDAIPLDTVPDMIRYEGNVMVRDAGKGYVIGFGYKASANEYFFRNAVRFSNDGYIRYDEGLKKWQPGIWYHVSMECNFTTLKGRICIDDSLAAYGFDISDKDVCDDFAIGGENFRSGTSTAFFDDIRIYYKNTSD